MKWGLLEWSKHVGHTVLGYQPENMGRHADVSTVMHWSSLGRSYHVMRTGHSYDHTSHHSLSPEFAGFAGDPSVSVRLVLPSCLLKVATQHPGSLDAKYGHKNDMFPLRDIFTLKKTSASWLKH